MMSLAEARRHLPPDVAREVPDERLKDILKTIYALAEVAVEARPRRHVQSPQTNPR